jgi:flavorubredoxin
LHGPVWRNNLTWYIEKYQKWSSYTPENETVMIAYASIYGNTENAVNILASALADRGIKNIVVYDTSVTRADEIVSEAFRCSHIVFAAPTYNAGIFIKMEEILLDIKAHNLQNRTVAFIENGSWAATSGNLMRELVASMKNMNIIENIVSIKSSLKEEQLEDINKLADAIVATMPPLS